MAQLRPVRAIDRSLPDLLAYAEPIERDELPIRVTDDFPAVIPVTDSEVRVIEAWLGDVLDELFGPLP